MLHIPKFTHAVKRLSNASRCHEASTVEELARHETATFAISWSISRSCPPSMLNIRSLKLFTNRMMSVQMSTTSLPMTGESVVRGGLCNTQHEGGK